MKRKVIFFKKKCLSSTYRALE